VGPELARCVHYISDQSKCVIENVPLEHWVKWDSNRTPGAYANAMRSTSKWGGGIQMAISPTKKNYNDLVCEAKPEEPGVYRCISRFEFSGAVKDKAPSVLLPQPLQRSQSDTQDHSQDEM
jgi:hypothetical protein